MTSSGHASGRATRIAILLLATAGGLLLAGGIPGCTLFPAPEPHEMRHYVLDLPDAETPEELIDQKGDHERIGASARHSENAVHLCIRPTESNSFLTSTRIAFTRDRVTRGSYQYAVWVESPPSRLSALLLRRLEREKIFAAVSRNPLPSDFILATELLEFVHDASSRPGVTVVELRAELIDGRKRELLDSTTFAARVPLRSYDAAGAVEGFGRALAEIFDALVRWVREGSAG